MDIRGVLIGWLCPIPHMTLAQPRNLTKIGEPDLTGSAILAGAMAAGTRHASSARAFSGL